MHAVLARSDRRANMSNTNLQQPLTGDDAATKARVMAEIAAAPMPALFGADQIDWGEGKGDKLYECWKLEPCCGQPCNPMDAIYCLGTFYCCGICAMSNLAAKALGFDQWGIWPHCLCFYCCPLCMSTATRYNLRRRQNVPGNIVGDFFISWCCSSCAMCQQLRSVPKSMWDLLPISVTVQAPLKFIN